MIGNRHLLLILMVLVTTCFSIEHNNENSSYSLSSLIQIMSKEEIDQEFGETLNSLPPKAHKVILYFKKESTSLTPNSMLSFKKLLELTQDKVAYKINIIAYQKKNESETMLLNRAEKIQEKIFSRGTFREKSMPNDREVLIFLVTDCCFSSNKNSIVLVDSGKKKNAVMVQNKKASIVLDKIRATVDMKSSNESPSKIRIMSKEELQRRFGHLLDNMPREPKSYFLYFEPNSMELSNDSEFLLMTILQSIENQMPCIVDVIGRTDTKGSNEGNLKISLKRANKVTQLLESYGIQKKVLKVKGYGEENLLIATEDNVAEFKNRSVEVFIK